MKLWGRTVLAAVGLFALGASAQAQDAFWAATPVANNWTGFYIGGQAGIVGMKTHEESPTLITGGNVLLGEMPAQIGAFAGFHYQVTDWWVWGLDVEANYHPGEAQYNGTKFGFMDWDASVRVQGGVPITPNILAYGSVGYSWSHFDQSAFYSVASPGSTGANYIGSGVQLGLGIDAKIHENLMLRMLATWAHYGTHDITNGGVTVATSTPSYIDARVGLAWSF